MSNVTFKPLSFDEDEQVGFKIDEQDLKPVAENTETESIPSKVLEDEKEIAPSTTFGENDKNFTVDDDFLADKKPAKENVLDVFKGEEEKEVEDKGVNPDYKSLTDYFITKGIFSDFEGREDLEYTEENFQAILEYQVKNAVHESLSEERSQFGSNANQLIDYLKDGGTVEDFTANYTQQLEIASLDTSEESGQEKAIKEYYKSIDWSDTKIRKHIERLKDSGTEDFKEEADDCKSKLVSAIEEERAEMVKQQAQIAEENKFRVESFNKAIRTSIFSDSASADRDKKELDKFYFTPTKQDSQGNKYTDFMIKRNEIFADPKKFSKYIKFIKNFDEFEDKKVAEKEEKKATFQFLKSGQQPFSNVSSKEPIKQKTEKIKPLKFLD